MDRWLCAEIYNCLQVEFCKINLYFNFCIIINLCIMYLRELMKTDLLELAPHLMHTSYLLLATANNPLSLINGLMFSGMNSKMLAGGFRDDNHPEHHMQLWNRWTLETDSVRFSVVNSCRVWIQQSNLWKKFRVYVIDEFQAYFLWLIMNVPTLYYIFHFFLNMKPS